MNRSTLLGTAALLAAGLLPSYGQTVKIGGDAQLWYTQMLDHNLRLNPKGGRGYYNLRGEFQDVVCSFVPMHSIVRIDQVEKGGVAKISEPKGVSGSNVSPFPVSFPPPPDRNRPKP